MSHIIEQDDSFKVIDDVFSLHRKEGLSKEVVCYALECLLPRDNGELLINYNVKENFGSAAFFNPRYNTVFISLSSLINWVVRNSVDMLRDFNIVNDDLFHSYLFLYVLTHEIEHGYQYLISKDIIPAPCSLVRSGYRGLLQLFEKDDRLIPNPINDIRKLISSMLYRKNENLYVLERNANTESFDLVVRYALLRDDKDMVAIFSNMKNIFNKVGYFDGCCGSFEDTYKNILMFDKYMKFDNNYELSDEEKIRYGLPISEEIRKKVLSLK